MTANQDGNGNWGNPLKARRLGIDTQDEAVIFLRKDSEICRSEGFASHARVQVTHGEKSIVATLFQITANTLHHFEAGFSDSAWYRLGLTEAGEVTVRHPAPLESLGSVRSKVYGHRLSYPAFYSMISDVVAGRYSGIQLSSLITACAARALDIEETIALTRSMVEVGDKLTWQSKPVVDKHSVGGLPGNRTTPIVVAIVAACGLTIPKTSSRAITSPAGTADVMETLTRIDLDLPQMRRVIEREGGCIVWGGAVRLSPADDIFIRVERVLDLDSEGQLVASVLSKKIAAGASHVVLDLPIGPTAKIRSQQAADEISASLIQVADAFGLRVTVVKGDGTQPIGRGIGPALEAKDVLAVLKGSPDAPAELRARALCLAGAALEIGGAAPVGEGFALAEAVLNDGRALAKFQRICEAQGGMREPPEANYKKMICATHSGHVTGIDNRKLARLAKLAGAPDDKAAGVLMHVRLGDSVLQGETLYTLHAESPGELEYALNYARHAGDIITVSAP